MKKDDPLFSPHATAQLAYGDCPQCGSPLQMKFVGKNSFLGCTTYPHCDYSKSLNKQDVQTLKLIDDSHCPECNAQLAVKKGRYGMFIGCTDFPNCHFISNKQQMQQQSKYKPISCPSCNNGTLIKKQNRFGKFFFACDDYPKCKTIFNQEPVAKPCPKCGGAVMLIKSKGENVFICAQSECGHVVNETKNEQ